MDRFSIRAGRRCRIIGVLTVLSGLSAPYATLAESIDSSRPPSRGEDGQVTPVALATDDQGEAIVIDEGVPGEIAIPPDAAPGEIRIEAEPPAAPAGSQEMPPAAAAVTARPGGTAEEIRIEGGTGVLPEARPPTPQPPVPTPVAAGPEGAAEEIRIETETSPPRIPAEPAKPRVPGAIPPPVEPLGERWSIALARSRIEYGQLTKSSNPVNTSDYANAIVRVNSPAWDKWELQLEARGDAYLQTGTPSLNRVLLDYGDSYVRYRGNSFRVTAGAETILWGRIDEIAPEDRLSVVDLTRGILYDLPDRRRAAPAVRLETFIGGDNKLDLVWLPYFRSAQLPDKDSIWYPVNQLTGDILGIETTPLIRAVVHGAYIDDSAPYGQNGFGARFSSTTASLDYGLTVQWNRQSLPYFRYEPTTNTLEAQYPRSWVYGGDVGFEAASAIWRAEAVYVTDVPVTSKRRGYTTVGGINWAGGVELNPGDTDVRVNLQIFGRNLINAPAVDDVYPFYALNGTLDWSFAHDRWKAKVRFIVGLNISDTYINPEIAFLGWEPNELYLAGHYFDGSNGTLGGYWQNDSMITLGWRGKF